MGFSLSVVLSSLVSVAREGYESFCLLPAVLIPVSKHSRGDEDSRKAKYDFFFVFLIFCLFVFLSHTERCLMQCRTSMDRATNRGEKDQERSGGFLRDVFRRLPDGQGWDGILLTVNPAAAMECFTQRKEFEGIRS
jgi:hypothetical protein